MFKNFGGFSLSDESNSKVIDYFALEAELAMLATSVSADFDWRAGPHLPVKMGLPAGAHLVRILQFDTVPALPCQLSEEGNNVGASQVDRTEMLDRSGQLSSSFKARQGRVH
eukprot:7034035-Pyramimonas_sp.AAC.1